MTEEEKDPTINDIMVALGKDLLVLETKRKQLEQDDLIECIANILVNQLIIFSIIKENLNIDKIDTCKSEIYV